MAGLVSLRPRMEPPTVRMAEARLPAPFAKGVEYSAPARGTWTIMHIGLLVPEAHQIFICAEACLRGVVMSAAELNAMDRFSCITIEDNNLLEGDTEEVLIEGVRDILAKLPYRPKAVLLYTSCVHEFIGSDLTFTFARLRSIFPDIAFTDCYMSPVLRERIAPDPQTRRQIYTLLEPAGARDGGVSVIGDVRPMDEGSSDILQMIRASGRPYRTITSTRTWEEYQQLAVSENFISMVPTAGYALAWIEKNLGGRTEHLSVGWTAESIHAALSRLAAMLGQAEPDRKAIEGRCTAALTRLREALSGMPVAIDYTATTRPGSLARALIEAGIRVERIFTDTVLPADREDFEWLRANAPDLELHPTVSHGMVFARRREKSPVLCVGQKAAWFCSSPRFVNMVEDDGLYGCSGLEELVRRMIDAIEHPKDPRDIIQVKALGCTRGGCL